MFIALIFLSIINYSTQAALTRTSIQIPVVNRDNYNSLQQNFVAAVKRTPLAITATVRVGGKSVISNLGVMIPLCGIAGLFHGHPSSKVWFFKSVRSALQFGVIAGIFSGGEEFLKVLRAKDDVWNRAVASGKL